jgi:hypothetical protein
MWFRECIPYKPSIILCQEKNIFLEFGRLSNGFIVPIRKEVKDLEGFL